MTAAQQNYNVLIMVKTPEVSEGLISTFRSGGLATRAHRVTSKEDLLEHLDSEQWDLLIADDQHPDVSIPDAIEQIQKSGLDIPVIMISEDTSEETAAKAFDIGVDDILDISAKKHFVHAAKREMDNARQRNQARQLKKDYEELNNRAAQLLSESDEAIAYISDGIITQTNDKLAELFAYQKDDLDCASIIDLIADEDQDKFKNFIRHFQKGEEEQTTELSFNGVKFDGSKFEAFMTLTNSTLEGEPCVQINITTDSGGGASSALGSGTVDAATDLHNRYYLADKIASTAIQVANGASKASLLVYKLDETERLLDEVYLSGLDLIIKDLAAILSKDLGPDDFVARFETDSVVVLLNKKAEDSLDFAKTTLKAIEDNISELKSGTVQFTCTCGILDLNKKDVTEMLDNCVQSISAIRLDHAKNSAQVFVPPEKEVAPLGADEIANIDEAIEMGTFMLRYQPMMSLQGDELENYEVTLWMQDGENLIYPERLIAGAQDSKLDRWIILEATKALSTHRAEGHNTRLMINLTVNAIKDKGLAAWLGVAIKAANLSNDALVFQFQEEDIRKNLKASIAAISALRDAKFMVSVSHFGKDSDPFKLTKHVPLDFLKIDPRFTESITSGDTEELKQLISTAKDQKIKTVLPEVDNAGALATLWQLGTHYIQGSYLQNPMPEMSYEFTEIA